jgi:hypothetical protein
MGVSRFPDEGLEWIYPINGKVREVRGHLGQIACIIYHL